jgi:hypothetical protein
MTSAACNTGYANNPNLRLSSASSSAAVISCPFGLAIESLDCEQGVKVVRNSDVRLIVLYPDAQPKPTHLPSRHSLQSTDPDQSVEVPSQLGVFRYVLLEEQDRLFPPNARAASSRFASRSQSTRQQTSQSIFPFLPQFLGVLREGDRVQTDDGVEDPRWVWAGI